jgi:Family of unknown function (DUF5677)
MPTLPDPKFLDRGEVASVLIKWADIFAELTNFGSRIMSLVQFRTESHPFKVATMLLFREALIRIDKFSILFRAGAAESCRPDVRALIEIAIYLRYLGIQKVPGERQNKSLSLIYHFKLKQLSEMKLSSPNTQESKQMKAKMRREVSMIKYDLRNDKIVARIAALEKELNGPIFEEVRLQRQSSKLSNPEWFSLFGGPQGLDSLAERVKLPAAYELGYKHYSSPTHGTGSLLDITYEVSLTAEPSLLPIRTALHGWYTSEEAQMFAHEIFIRFLELQFEHTTAKQIWNDWFNRAMDEELIGGTILKSPMSERDT